MRMGRGLELQSNDQEQNGEVSTAPTSELVQCSGQLQTTVVMLLISVKLGDMSTLNLSPINLVSIFRCSSPPCNPVHTRRVDPSGLPFSLSSHRYSYIGLLFNSHFNV
jgi:hypothetical protein